MTEQAQHTPGPWHDDGFGVITGGPGSMTSIAETPECRWIAAGKVKLADEAIANARLIAAAPELLTDLRDISGRCPVGVLTDLNRYEITLTGQTINTLRKTLAKARP